MYISILFYLAKTVIDVVSSRCRFAQYVPQRFVFLETLNQRFFVSKEENNMHNACSLIVIEKKFRDRKRIQFEIISILETAAVSVEYISM